MKQTSGWTFPLFGVPLTIQPSYFLIVALLGSQRLPDVAGIAIWIGVVTFSILWHEFGHVIGFRAFGQESRIELWSFGGLTWPKSWDPEKHPWPDVVVSLAGPAVGLLLGAATYAVAESIEPISSPDVRTAIDDLLWVNIGWSILNLLPLLPLDGGRVLSSTLRAIFHGKEGAAANFVSLAIAAAAALYGVTIGDIWIVFLALWLGSHNAQGISRRKGTPEQQGAEPSPPKQTWVIDALDLMERGDLKTPERRARAKLSYRTEERDHPQAATILMWISLIRGNMTEAAALCDQHLSTSVMRPLLHPGVSAATGGTGNAVNLLERAFQAHPSQATALQLVQALIEVGRLDDARQIIFDPRLQPIDELAARLVHVALIEGERHEAAVEMGVQLFEDRADATTAYNVACSLALLKRRDEALEWLERAIDSGFESTRHLDSDPDLDALRRHAKFRAMRQRLKA